MHTYALYVYSVCAMHIDICTILCAQCIQRFVDLILTVSPARLKLFCKAKIFLEARTARTVCSVCSLTFFVLDSNPMRPSEKGVDIDCVCRPSHFRLSLPKLPGLFVLLSAKPRQKAGVISSFPSTFNDHSLPQPVKFPGWKARSLTHTPANSIFYSPVISSFRFYFQWPFNPFTVKFPAWKVLKHVCEQYILLSCNKSTFIAVRFGKNPSHTNSKKKTVPEDFRFCTFIGRFQLTSRQWKG